MTLWTVCLISISTVHVCADSNSFKSLQLLKPADSWSTHDHGPVPRSRIWAYRGNFGVNPGFSVPRQWFTTYWLCQRKLSWLSLFDLDHHCLISPPTRLTCQTPSWILFIIDCRFYNLKNMVTSLMCDGVSQGFDVIFWAYMEPSVKALVCSTVWSLAYSLG